MDLRVREVSPLVDHHSRQGDIDRDVMSAAALTSEAAAAIEAASARSRPSLHLLPIRRARECYEEDRRGPRTPPLHRVQDLVVTRSVPVRIYRPRPGRLPVVVYLHGGGWVVGSLDTHERICRGLADRSNSTLLSVEYRLAPEHASLQPSTTPRLS